MTSYDRMDWHYGGDFPKTLPTENGGTHIGMHLAWIISNDLHSDMHRHDSNESIQKVLKREWTGREFLINECDGKLWKDNMNEKGNEFTRFYYEIQEGNEISYFFDDYFSILGEAVYSIYEIENTWENYDILKPLIDKRYNDWRAQEVKITAKQKLLNSTTIPILEFETASLFEAWLKKNHSKSKGLWLKLFKKSSKKATITYAEALDAALCYGWIDGQKQSHDEEAWLQKFCPRGAKSVWSKINTGHVERLIEEGRMTQAGLDVVEKAKADGRWGRAYESPSKMTVPEDFLKVLSKNKEAAAFYKGLNKANLFAIGFRLQTAKKQDTRERRMMEIIEKLAKGEKLH